MKLTQATVAVSKVEKKKIKILVPNKYQLPGGEDAAARAEINLLRGHGHDLVEYIRHNDKINEYGLMEKT